MATAKRTIWDIEEHTRAKHAILRRYLNAWIPILSHGRFDRLAFIDGFAGPGTYTDGSDGSPILALKAYLEQPTTISAEIDFHFVEQDPERAAHLKRLVDALLASAGPRPRMRCTIHSGKDFATAYDEIVRSERGRTPATFAFIDPFGWTGMPMSLVRRILDRPATEVFVNFMFEEINRFLAHPDQGTNFDDLFGGPEWRSVAALTGKERQLALRELYSEKLLAASNDAFIRHFEMRNKRSNIDYYLFFATKSLHGLKKMKEAMWKADPQGQFRFSDATDANQMILFDGEVETPRLQVEIRREFGGRTVGVDEIEEFVVVETAFRETHYKSVLKAIEADGKLQVVDPRAGRRRGTFPMGTVVKFV